MEVERKIARWERVSVEDLCLKMIDKCFDYMLYYGISCTKKQFHNRTLDTPHLLISTTSSHLPLYNLHHSSPPTMPSPPLITPTFQSTPLPPPSPPPPPSNLHHSPPSSNLHHSPPSSNLHHSLPPPLPPLHHSPLSTTPLPPPISTTPPLPPPISTTPLHSQTLTFNYSFLFAIKTPLLHTLTWL